jgi:hypothetical protein
MEFHEKLHGKCHEKSHGKFHGISWEIFHEKIRQMFMGNSMKFLGIP